MSGNYPYENWMGDIHDKIKNKTLYELCIPGTHDSGAYNLEATDPLGAPGVNWANTQERTITEQLAMGIRAFDIRLMYVGDPNAPTPVLTDVRIMHSADNERRSIKTFLGQSIDVILDAIDAFLASHPREIVLFKIHQAALFNPQVEALVCQAMDQRFAACAIPFSDINGSIGTLLANRGKGRIVLVYEDASLSSPYPYLWTKSWVFEYPETMSIPDMLDDNNQFLNRESGTATSIYESQFILTATYDDIVRDLLRRPWIDALFGGAGAAAVTSLIALSLVPGVGWIGAIIGALAGWFANSQTPIKSIKDMAQVANPFTYGRMKFAWAGRVNVFSVDYFEEGGDFVKLARDINAGSVAVPAAGNLLQSDTSAILMSQGEHYIGNFETSNNANMWEREYYPTLVDQKTTFVYLINGPQGNVIRDGDEVLITSQETGLLWEGTWFNRLMAWDTPILFYYKDGSKYADRQKWTIHKLDNSTPEVHFNDVVWFTNKYWDGQYLTPSDSFAGKYLTTKVLPMPYLWRISA